MFVHLHAHSYYSFLQATASPKALVGAAKAAGFEAMALTDSANTCGIVEAFEAAEKEKCKLVVGVEVWTIDGESADGPAPGVQLVLLVKDHGGWRNLCRLLTKAHRQRNYTPRIRLDQLAEHREGLHVLTGSRYGLFQEETRAKERLTALVRTVGPDAVDVEVCDLGFDEDGPRNDLAISLAKELSLPVLATNDVRYLGPEDCGLLEAMGVIATADLVLSRTATATDQATLKTEAEMKELFPAAFLDRTTEVARICSFVLPRGKPMLPRVSEDESQRDIMARFPAPKGFPAPPKRLPGKGKPVDRWFRWLTKEGLQIRLREEPHALEFWTEEEYFRQLDFECGVIEGMDYVVYHLIVSEFTNWAKDNDVAVGPGRGSAAGSVAVWALRITDVNPRQFGLFFERFLNPERRGLPDIDMDFEQEGRERVVAHVREKYGEACVGQILTIGKMKAKAALKDAARVCDVHFEESNRWSRLVPEGPKVKLKDSIDFGYLGAMRTGSSLFRRVSDLALLLEGKPRQQGVHAAGVIIASDPLTDFCPMHYVPEDALTCTGVDMEASEKIGLVKFDFLGLKTLDVVKRAVASVLARTGTVPATVDPLFDDPAVFEMLRKADTEGIFQLESAGMTRLIKRLQPTDFEEVICMLALYRPGPLRAGMVDSWVERKHGREKVESIHPLLDELLAPTYGLMVYQEQAINTARILAGFTLGNADLLRRAIGKKKADEMAAQRTAFVGGCRETNGIDEKEANRIFNLIDYFSGYSFNKAHSAAYAIISYMTAKLKVYHRADFLAASMTLELGSQNYQARIRQYVSVLRRSKIHVLRPDVNRSGAAFTEEGGAVRFGLRAVKGLGHAQLPQLLANRPYADVVDLVDRGGIHRSVAETLVWSGALDSVEPDRFEAWWKLHRPKPKALPKKVAAEQVLLFGGGKTVGDVKAEEDEAFEASKKPVKPTSMQISDRESEVLGVTLGEHPLRTFEDVAVRVRTHSIEALYQIGAEKSPFVLVVRVEAVEFDEDRRGDPVAFVTFEDGGSSLEVVLRSQVLQTIDRDATLFVGACVAAHGVADAFDPENPRVVVERLEPMPEFRWRVGHVVEIEVLPSDRQILPALRKLLDEKTTDGTHDVQIWVRAGEDSVKLMLDRKICPSDDLVSAFERLCGRPNVMRLPKVGDGRRNRDEEMESIEPVDDSEEESDG